MIFEKKMKILRILIYYVDNGMNFFVFYKKTSSFFLSDKDSKQKFIPWNFSVLLYRICSAGLRGSWKHFLCYKDVSSKSDL